MINAKRAQLCASCKFSLVLAVVQDVSSCHSCGSAVSELACQEAGTAKHQKTALLSGRIQSGTWPSGRTPGCHQQAQSTQHFLTICKSIVDFPTAAASKFLFSLCASHCQVLPQDALVSESGELTELGRSYVPPRILLDALCVVCSSASQWGDHTEAETLAMKILIVTHHPSIGMRVKLPGSSG